MSNEDQDMQIEAVTMAGVERAHASLNAAFNAIAMDRDVDPIAPDVELARGYIAEARGFLQPGGGHDGHDDAATAARAVLPRLERALQLLDELAVAGDPVHVTPLLDELGIAMDHVETALAAVGWS